MKQPSRVSNRLIPAANRIGSERTAQNGRPLATAVPERTSRATSVAVSNPSPNRTPIGYIFHGVSTRRAIDPKNLFIRPRWLSWSSRASSS